MRSIAEIFASHEVLDAQGRHLNGTDKNGPCHSYGHVYENILSVPEKFVAVETGYALQTRSIREDVKLMMEIGVADGSSLLAWAEVFPNATCVGMDIHHSDRAHGDRIEFHIGDQRSFYDCQQVAAGRLFDFICEDATHQLGNSLQTLLYLWPSVRPGGLYVIEEFDGVLALRSNIKALFPFATINDSHEPLVALRKPL